MIKKIIFGLLFFAHIGVYPSNDDLLHSVRNGDAARVRRLIDSGLVNVNYRNVDGESPLGLAILIDNPEIVQMLLGAGADPNDQSPAGEAVLVKANELNRIAIVKLLLDAGANPNIQTDFAQNTPLMRACVLADLQRVLWFLAAGADPNIQNRYKETALLLASKWQAVGIVSNDNKVKIVRALLAAGADPNKQDYRGDTALRMAAQYRNTQLIPILLQAGADPNVRNLDDGKTALEIIEEYPLLQKVGLKNLAFLLKIFSALQYRKLDNPAVSTAPPDYIQRFAREHDAALCEQDLEQRIQEAEQNQINYLYEQVFIGYQANLHGNNKPLVRFFCDEIYPKLGLLGLLEGFVFRSKSELLRCLQSLLNELKKSNSSWFFWRKNSDVENDVEKIEFLINQIE